MTCNDTFPLINIDRNGNFWIELKLRMNKTTIRNNLFAILYNITSSYVISVKKYLTVRVRVCVCVGLHITFCCGVMEEHNADFEGYAVQ